MRPEDVPQEWVDIVCDEIGAAELCGDSSCKSCTRTLRTALAAVIPLIQAREREEYAAMLQQMLDDVPNGNPRSYEMAHYCMGLEEALTAIRARGTP